MSILVTVLDNDDRINSKNFGERLKTSLMKHLSGENFLLLNATVYGKHALVMAIITYVLLIILFLLHIQMHVHHRTSH